MSAPLRLRIVTFNIHGGRPRIGTPNLEATARVIRELRPDLVGLQEVHRYLPPPYVFQDQPRKLRELLGMEVCFLRSFGFGPFGYGNAILSRVPPDRVQRTRLPSRLEARALLEAEFTLEGRKLRFWNTHLSLDDRGRTEELKVIAGRTRQSELPLLLVGDWNATPDSGEMDLLEAAGLSHCADDEVLTFPCDNPTCRLDYLMASRHFEVERCWSVQTDVSDHLPLAADVVLRS